MLQTKTVEPATLSLIKSLQSKSYVNDFLLVGGTALALQIGHRTSTDIDLFNNDPFSIPEISTENPKCFFNYNCEKVKKAINNEVKKL